MRYRILDYITVVVLALLMGYVKTQTHWVYFPIPLPFKIAYRTEGGIRRRFWSEKPLRSQIWGKEGQF